MALADLGEKIWRAEVKWSGSLLCHVRLFATVDYTVHGILQARILDWVAVPCSRGSSQPRNRSQVSWIAGGFFTSWATRKTQEWCNFATKPWDDESTGHEGWLGGRRRKKGQKPKRMNVNLENKVHLNLQFCQQSVTCCSFPCYRSPV